MSGRGAGAMEQRGLSDEATRAACKEGNAITKVTLRPEAVLRTFHRVLGLREGSGPGGDCDPVQPVGCRFTYLRCESGRLPSRKKPRVAESRRFCVQTRDRTGCCGSGASGPDRTAPTPFLCLYSDV